jgi:hypothetical protein
VLRSRYANMERERDRFADPPQARGCSRRAIQLEQGRQPPWRDLHDVRQQFPDAGQFKSLLIFNIRRSYRLIVKGVYPADTFVEVVRDIQVAGGIRGKANRRI